MATIRKITLSGGFHNVAPITVHVRFNGELNLSIGQYKRLKSHMCTYQGCQCGWRGFDLSGVDRLTFNEMLLDVNYRIDTAGNYPY